MAAVAEPSHHVAFRPARRAPAPARSRNGGLAVISANLWHDWPRRRHWPARLESLAQLVEAQHADVVLLQEVARTPSLYADEWLADRLGMECLYVRANGHAAAIGFEEGVAVLSRFSLGSPQLHQFHSRLNPFVRRVALGAVAATPAGPLAVVSLHLSLWPGHNARQLAVLPGWVSRLAGPHAAVVGGDFNAPEHRASIGRTQAVWLDTFRHIHPHAEGSTHEWRWPWRQTWWRRRLDYIFLQPGRQPWRVVDARHVDAPDRRHSDHRAVVAIITPQTQP